MSFEWTDRSIAKLRVWWDENVPTAEIGRRLGTSKSSVVGKAHRLDLPGKPSPITGRPITEDRVAEMRRLYAEGYSFVAIGREIGAHESAVRGRLTKEGLPQRYAPVKSLPPLKSLPPTERAAQALQSVPIRVKPQTPPPLRLVPREVRVEHTRSSHVISRNHTCQWILPESTRGRPPLMCGDPAVIIGGNAVWCLAHLKVVFKPKVPVHEQA
jgi:GcrA cell cycle regulator